MLSSLCVVQRHPLVYRGSGGWMRRVVRRTWPAHSSREAAAFRPGGEEFIIYTASGVVYTQDANGAEAGPGTLLA